MTINQNYKIRYIASGLMLILGCALLYLSSTPTLAATPQPFKLEPQHKLNGSLKNGPTTKVIPDDLMKPKLTYQGYDSLDLSDEEKLKDPKDRKIFSGGTVSYQLDYKAGPVPSKNFDLIVSWPANTIEEALESAGGQVNLVGQAVTWPNQSVGAEQSIPSKTLKFQLKKSIPLEIQQLKISANAFKQTINQRKKVEDLQDLWSKLPVVVKHAGINRLMPDVSVKVLKPRVDRLTAQEQIEEDDVDKKVSPDDTSFTTSVTFGGQNLSYDTAGHAVIPINRMQHIAFKNEQGYLRLRVQLVSQKHAIDGTNNERQILTSLDYSRPVFSSQPIQVSAEDFDSTRALNLLINNDSQRWATSVSNFQERLGLATLYSTIIGADEIARIFFKQEYQYADFFIAEGPEHHGGFVGGNSFYPKIDFVRHDLLFLAKDKDYNLFAYLHEMGHIVAMKLSDRLPNGSHKGIFDYNSGGSYAEGLAHYFGLSTLSFFGVSNDVVSVGLVNPSTEKMTKFPLPIKNILSPPFGECMADIHYNPSSLLGYYQKHPPGCKSGPWSSEELSFTRLLMSLTEGNTLLDKEVPWVEHDAIADPQLPVAPRWNELLALIKDTQDMEEYFTKLREKYGSGINNLLIKFGFFKDTNGDWQYNPHEQAGTFVNGSPFIVLVNNYFENDEYKKYATIESRNDRKLLNEQNIDQINIKFISPEINDIVPRTVHLAVKYNAPYEHLSINMDFSLEDGEAIAMLPEWGFLPGSVIFTAEGSSDASVISSEKLNNFYRTLDHTDTSNDSIPQVTFTLEKGAIPPTPEQVIARGETPLAISPAATPSATTPAPIASSSVAPSASIQPTPQQVTSPAPSITNTVSTNPPSSIENAPPVSQSDTQQPVAAVLPIPSQLLTQPKTTAPAGLTPPTVKVTIVKAQTVAPSSTITSSSSPIVVPTVSSLARLRAATTKADATSAYNDFKKEINARFGQSANALKQKRDQAIQAAGKNKSAVTKAKKAYSASLTKAQKTQKAELALAKKLYDTKLKELKAKKGR